MQDNDDEQFQSFKTARSQRQRALIRKFRLEFAKTIVIDASTKRPAEALTTAFYLNKFDRELARGLYETGDLKVIGQDLAVINDVINSRLDIVISEVFNEKKNPHFVKNFLNVLNLSGRVF